MGAVHPSRGATQSATTPCLDQQQHLSQHTVSLVPAIGFSMQLCILTCRRLTPCRMQSLLWSELPPSLPGMATRHLSSSQPCTDASRQPPALSFMRPVVTASAETAARSRRRAQLLGRSGPAGGAPVVTSRRDARGRAARQAPRRLTTTAATPRRRHARRRQVQSCAALPHPPARSARCRKCSDPISSSLAEQCRNCSGHPCVPGAVVLAATLARRRRQQATAAAGVAAPRHQWAASAAHRRQSASAAMTTMTACKLLCSHVHICCYVCGYCALGCNQQLQKGLHTAAQLLVEMCRT